MLDLAPRLQLPSQSAPPLPFLITSMKHHPTHLEIHRMNKLKAPSTTAQTIALCTLSYAIFMSLILLCRQCAHAYLASPTRELFVNSGH